MRNLRLSQPWQGAVKGEPARRRQRTNRPAKVPNVDGPPPPPHEERMAAAVEGNNLCRKVAPSINVDAGDAAGLSRYTLRPEQVKVDGIVDLDAISATRWKGGGAQLESSWAIPRTTYRLKGPPGRGYRWELLTRGQQSQRHRHTRPGWPCPAWSLQRWAGGKIGSIRVWPK